MKAQAALTLTREGETLTAGQGEVLFTEYGVSGPAVFDLSRRISTGGDGIGALDPVFLQLPNSGILVQFTMMFGLNGDGSSSEETGTTPDILSPAGEPALVTALRAMEGVA